MAELPTRYPSARPRPLTDWAQLRVAANISLRRAAALSGVNDAYISQIEAGRLVPTAAEARALLAVYDVEIAPRQAAAPGEAYRFIGARPCGGATCRAVIYWWETPARRRGPTGAFPSIITSRPRRAHPYDRDGVSHWATCPDASFRPAKP